ncbi:hypothetical protein BOW53_01220 [Solemya pervernicosa gill symbiont]|uniref:Response regulatory domain-containing protein n=1 Tax=Solemya pervernicosa gill symbiont TaxID=642797 RepID=A0A1T2LAU4_9GAMM|nr:response regulator [Solemya pervernicosa gill symbiont]OOZ42229.1 hypothetical protein BOW53_01220 [Solemya pervernicosa gill symbiont]
MNSESPMGRTLLLVDDEENILRALVRLLRRDGYKILTADSGKAGLDILREHDVGVLLSDQRMPGMSGSEFLAEVRKLYPETVRMVLSGYTDLSSVTNAINHGSIYRFLSKPWEDDLLRENIKDAFQHQELASENVRLAAELKHANELLEGKNRELLRDVEEQMETLQINLRALDVTQEILEKLPVAVMGIGDDGTIAVANVKANQLLSRPSGMVGQSVSDVMPAELIKLFARDERVDHPVPTHLQLGEMSSVSAYCCRIGEASDGRGSILVLIENPKAQLHSVGGSIGR